MAEYTHCVTFRFGDRGDIPKCPALPIFGGSGGAEGGANDRGENKCVDFKSSGAHCIIFRSMVIDSGGNQDRRGWRILLLERWGKKKKGGWW